MTGATKNGQDFISRLREIVEANFQNEQFGVTELAREMNMSRSKIHRQIKTLTNLSISQFIRKVRLEEALKMLQNQEITASEVSYAVGFRNPTYFNKCFHEYFGYPPGEARKVGWIEGGIFSSEKSITPSGKNPEIALAETKSKWIQQRGKLLVVASGIIVCLFVVFIIMDGFNSDSKGFKTSGNVEKSIMVLPFKNLCSDENNQYFADGITEDILNHLSRISELRVISRTTSERFRNSVLPSTEIAGRIGINYLIEGSVRKDGDKVRITVQLIDGKTDHHLWSENYDRKLTDIFLIQSEIAQNIARELQAVITPAEKTLIEKVPTKNMEAYNYYLIGNNYYWRSYDIQDYSIAISMYSKAIELDPEFALAYIRLSLAHSAVYWFHFDRDYKRVTQTKNAIDAAIRLDPDLPEIHMALGYYYYRCLINYEKALEELFLAENKLLNNPECIFMKGSIYRRSGEWQAAMESFLLAYELNPGSSQIAQNIAATYFLLGEFTKAEEFFCKETLLNPTFVEPYYFKSLMYFKWKGNTVDARKTIREALKYREATNNCLIFETIALMDFYDGNYQKAISFLQSHDIEIMENQFYYHHKSFHIANIYRIMGETNLARSYYEDARFALESKLADNPDDPRFYSALGKIYAGLGMKEKAIEFGKKGEEMMPIKKEAYRGIFRVKDLALIFVITGEYHEALKQLDYLLSVPTTISVNLLLMDPNWKPLWNLPEFEILTSKYSRD